MIPAIPLLHTGVTAVPSDGLVQDCGNSIANALELPEEFFLCLTYGLTVCVDLDKL